jgi:hypothetical protein
MDRTLGNLGAAWGFGGIFLLIAAAVARLTPIALETFDHDLSGLQWTALVGFSVFMTIGEGYQGFQKAFAPRVAARARYLRDNPRPVHVAFAPFFCLAYFHTTPRRQAISISITLGIVCLVIATRFTDQPWRGIIDFGVVLGLVWGLTALAVFGYQALGTKDFSHSPEVPTHR